MQSSSSQEPKAVSELPESVVYVMIENATQNSPYFFEDSGGNKFKLNPLGDQNIPNEDNVMINGKDTPIRYLPSYGESLILKEQIDAGIPKIYQYQSSDRIEMRNGKLGVYPRLNPLLYEFMEMTNRNGSNPNRKKNMRPLFMRDDREAKNKKVVDDDRKITRAKAILYQIEHDAAKLKNVATLLNQDMNSEPSSLMKSLLEIAALTPDVIIDAFENNAGDVASVVFDAIEHGIIHFNGFSWQFSGREGEEAKIKVPNLRGRNHEDVARRKLTDFLQTEEGDALRQILEGIINKRS